MAGDGSSIKCWFSGVCPDANSTKCDRCVDRGIHYLANVLFIPKAQIPKAYQFIEIADMALAPEQLPIASYLDNVKKLVDEGKGFYSHGQGSGTGKTTFGCIALRRYLYYSLREKPADTENRRVLYLNTSEFLDRIRKSFDREDLELEKLMEELTSIELAPKLILFDDIGAERTNEWVQERLYNLLNFRSANGLANIFSSNYSPEELVPRLGNRIYDRIMGCSKPVKFSGKSHRRCEW